MPSRRDPSRDQEGKKSPLRRVGEKRMKKLNEEKKKEVLYGGKKDIKSSSAAPRQNTFRDNQDLGNGSLFTSIRRTKRAEGEGVENTATSNKP